MVHVFEKQKNYYAFDTESGSLHLLDENAYKVLKAKIENKVITGVDLEEIKSAEMQIEELKNAGLLFKEDINEIPFKSSELKALCLHICHDCNMSCKYCFASEGSYKGVREFMSLEVATRAIDFLIENSGKRKMLEVDFFGGEPLLNFETVKKTIAHARKREKETGKTFLFTLTTNALILDDEKIEYLNREMENVVLSIDGTQETNDEIRKLKNGKGSFDIIFKNIQKFVKMRGDKHYYVRGTFTAKNLNFSKDVLFLADSGFDQISVEPVVLPEGHELYISSEMIPILKEEYNKLAEEYLNRFKAGKPFNFFHFYIDLEGGVCLKKRVSACGAGNEYLSVTPNGNLFPCHQFADNPKFNMGNVFEGKIDENIRMHFKNSSLFTREKCDTCFAKYHCSGGCNANNYNFNGDINKPYEITCALMRERLELALHLYAQKKLFKGR